MLRNYPVLTYGCSGLKVTQSASGILIRREVTASIAGPSVQMESDLFSQK